MADYEETTSNCMVCGCKVWFEGGWSKPEYDCCVNLETPVKAGHVCDPCHRKMPCYETLLC